MISSFIKILMIKYTRDSEYKFLKIPGIDIENINKMFDLYYLNIDFTKCNLILLNGYSQLQKILKNPNISDTDEISLKNFRN